MYTNSIHCSVLQHNNTIILYIIMVLNYTVAFTVPLTKEKRLYYKSSKPNVHQLSGV